MSRTIFLRIPALLVAIGLTQGTAFGHSSPPGCSVNNLQADIALPPLLIQVPCGQSVPFTVRVFNGTVAGACDVTATPVEFTCPDPATGAATGPMTTLATSDDFTAVPPSSTTYPAVNCTIGSTVGGTCTCGGTNGVNQARVEAGPGILHLNPLDVDIADIIKTVSVQCVQQAGIRHEQCYELRRQTFATKTVTLADRFGSATATVRRPDRLCAPTDKNDEDPSAPSDPQHLTGYELDAAPSYLPLKGVPVQDQFGTLTLNLVDLHRLLVPAAKSLVSPPAPLSPTIEHFACYTVKRKSGTFHSQTVTVTDQFGTQTPAVVRPELLCVPTNKNDEDPNAPTDPNAFLCYDLRTRENLNIAPVFTNDQFGALTNTLIRRDELCVPATILPTVP